MPNGTEVDDFLNGVKSEVKEDPFKQESEDPFAVKEEVKEEKVEEEEKQVPFHRDPKIQRFIDKEISKRISEIKPTETERFVKETTNDGDDVLEVLTRVIGNDTPEKVAAVKDFRKMLSGLEEKGAQRAIQELNRKSEEERASEQRALDELNKGFEEIEETFGVDLSSNTAVARKTRNDFVDYIKRIAPKDAEGNVVAFPDLEPAFEDFQEKNKRVSTSTNRAKELSSRSMIRSSETSSAPTIADSSWNAVERLFSKLSG